MDENLLQGVEQHLAVIQIDNHEKTKIFEVMKRHELLQEKRKNNIE
jgi:hypothetical protein